MILLTGAAGFIGFHTAQALLAAGEQVIGVDNLNEYYDVTLKKARLEQLEKRDGFTFYKADIADRDAMQGIMDAHPQIDRIIHLAAQAGVRHSLTHPFDYEHSNLMGPLVLLELARHREGLKHFVYASSSSVYGGNTKQPFSIDDQVNAPVSLYAATKRAGELMTQSYSYLYNIPATGLRFFTVYGPWGRPDMAYFSFTRDILAGKPITVFNQGDMKRDFTWIDDVVSGIIAVLGHPPVAHGPHCIHDAPHRVFNLGNNRAESLLYFIETIETALGVRTEKIMAPMAPGDVPETYADIDASKEVFGYDPKTPLSEGIPQFVEWYRSFYGIEKAA
ncbi:MAG: SDR family NAD(P)-dependent oxidoreductase [Rhodospirillales bacterium]|nr:SDR family NAD(P)-dependent oxidoreductase [Rhodospirillales bacterium]MCB9997143.1 SDR family NAD(P)-dependent oxidoreductase [Rhodospirillales bacterium]